MSVYTNEMHEGDGEPEGMSSVHQNALRGEEPDLALSRDAAAARLTGPRSPIGMSVYHNPMHEATSSSGPGASGPSGGASYSGSGGGGPLGEARMQLDERAGTPGASFTTPRWCPGKSVHHLEQLFCSSVRGHEQR